MTLISSFLLFLCFSLLSGTNGFFPYNMSKGRRGREEEKEVCGGGVENGGRKEERDGQKEKMYRFSSQRF